MQQYRQAKLTSRARQMREERHRARGSSRTLIAILLVVLLGLTVTGSTVFVVASGAAGNAVTNLFWDYLDSPGGNDPAKVRFIVREGESAADIAERLEDRKLIKNALLFRWLARQRGLDAKFTPGEYELRQNMTASQIMSSLQQGWQADGLVTFPEGWRAVQMADALGRRQPEHRDEFLRLVESASFDFPFLRDRPPGASLEGYLFPETYSVTTTRTVPQLVETMLKTFGERAAPELAKAGSVGLTPHQALTLASIVEREARVPSERSLIAGVYLNRLRQGMMLQADPTVQYALAGLRPSTAPPEGYWKSVLLFADLDVESPYNTYRNKGLPPAPIASPGLAAIQATVNPTATEYLFFVAREDGRHEFAKTYEEHLANERRVRRDAQSTGQPR